MSLKANILKTEALAELCQHINGRLVIRSRREGRLALPAFARIIPQADGTFIIEPLGQEIDMTKAMAILGIPYTTLRRHIEEGRIKAHKRSKGRWVVDLESLLEFKSKVASDPEYWRN